MVSFFRNLSERAPTVLTRQVCGHGVGTLVHSLTAAQRRIADATKKEKRLTLTVQTYLHNQQQQKH
jgi:hypothetical protein